MRTNTIVSYTILALMDDCDSGGRGRRPCRPVRRPEHDAMGLRDRSGDLELSNARTPCGRDLAPPAEAEPGRLGSALAGVTGAVVAARANRWRPKLVEASATLLWVSRAPMLDHGPSPQPPTCGGPAIDCRFGVSAMGPERARFRALALPGWKAMRSALAGYGNFRRRGRVAGAHVQTSPRLKALAYVQAYTQHPASHAVQGPLRQQSRNSAIIISVYE
jgi:hypothetical protein